MIAAAGGAIRKHFHIGLGFRRSYADTDKSPRFSVLVCLRRA